MSVQKAQRKVKAGDIILLAVVLCSAAVLFLFLLLFTSHGAEVVVSMDGAEIGRYALDQDTQVTLPEGHILVIRDGEASVSYAPCRDQICVNHISISRSGETIVCLPYRLVITVEEGSA
ncbi:MAG: NusG domain II-containing protein [Ruminococcaceae bacterium]|nr:NusG domain II-containing protein [Oscillospiraceae bacterium]